MIIMTVIPYLMHFSELLPAIPPFAPSVAGSPGPQMPLKPSLRETNFYPLPILPPPISAKNHFQGGKGEYAYFKPPLAHCVGMCVPAHSFFYPASSIHSPHLKGIIGRGAGHGMTISPSTFSVQIIECSCSKLSCPCHLTILKTFSRRNAGV